MQTVWEKALNTNKPVLLYGTGNGADKIIAELERLGIRLNGVFASDGFVRKRTFRGFDVMSYSEAKAIFGNMLVLVAFGSSRQEVLKNIIHIASEQELYSVDVPVYEDTIFNRSFYESNRAAIEEVRELLADEQSKKVYDNIINFKLSGDINLLLSCQTPKKEAYDNILKLSKNEIYMDLGAFNGDTIKEFIEATDGYEKIYAVEPNIKNFKKLKDRTADSEKIELYNCCVSDFCGEISFFDSGGRSGHALEGFKKAPCRTIDDILESKKVTFIKLDVEGLEEKAIDGGRETIKKFKPRLAVSCYHRSEDIFALCAKVIAIRSDYKVYIRHNPYIPAWDTQFYFI